MTPSLKADSSCWRVRWRSECSADGVKEDFQAMGGATRFSSCVAVRDNEDGGRAYDVDGPKSRLCRRPPEYGTLERERASDGRVVVGIYVNCGMRDTRKYFHQTRRTRSARRLTGLYCSVAVIALLPPYDDAGAGGGIVNDGAMYVTPFRA